MYSFDLYSQYLNNVCHQCSAPKELTKLKIDQPGDKFEQEADQVEKDPRMVPQERTNPESCASYKPLSRRGQGASAATKSFVGSQSTGRALDPSAVGIITKRNGEIYRIKRPDRHPGLIFPAGF